MKQDKIELNQKLAHKKEANILILKEEDKTRQVAAQKTLNNIPTVAYPYLYKNNI